MKRLFSLLLAVLLVVSLAVPAAADGAAAKISSASGKPGDTVTLNVTLSGNPGAAYLKLLVGYDSSALKLVSAANSGTLSGSFTASPNTQVNPYVLSWTSAGDMTGNGTIATLTFEILSTAAVKSHTVTLAVDECYNQDLDDVTVSASGGSVTVTCDHKYGSWTKADDSNHKRTCSVCSSTETQAHTWNSGTVTKAATCKEAGVKTYTCSVCGGTKTEEIAKLTAHTFGAWTTTKAATCKEAGEKTRTCSVCGKTETDTIAKLTTHTYGNWEKVDNNNHKHTCSVCGSTETKAHTWNSGTVTKAATCKEAGVKTYTCSVCGGTKTEEIAKLTTHTFGSWTTTKAATCKEAGEKTRTCSVCGNTETDTIAKLTTHTYGNWEKVDDSNHKRTCSVCGNAETKAHTWNSGTVTKPATCKEDGVKTFTCTVCGGTKTEVISKQTAHTFGAWTTTKAATCKEAGEKARTCSVCGNTETDTIAKLTTHTYGNWEKVDDNNHKRTCSVCGNAETKAHTWNSGTVTKPATCKEAGVKTFTCSVCNAAKTQEIAKLTTHSFGAWEKDNNENHKHTCSVCELTETKAHTWNKGAVTKAATCKEAGVKTYTCTTCGETKTEEIAKLTTHSFSKWAKADDNSHKRVCSVCELEETGTHSYGTNWTSDAANHFHACSVCGDQKNAAAHTPGAAPTEKTAQTCTVCGRVLKAALGHTHKYAATLTKDETSHWYACSGCTVKKDAAAHSFDNACDTDCNVCGYERETEHSFAETWKSDAQSHWQECTACGEKTGMEEHVPGGEATEETAQTCTVCGYEVAAKLPHTHAFADEWESDADSHWQTCACGETNGKADHSWNDSGVCTVCAAQKPAEAQSGSSWLIIAAAAGIAAIGALLVVLKKKK